MYSLPSLPTIPLQSAEEYSSIVSPSWLTILEVDITVDQWFSPLIMNDKWHRKTSKYTKFENMHLLNH